MQGNVAITGMSCRFPGVADIEAFWRVLAEGRETVTRGLGRNSASTDPHLTAVDAFGVLGDIDCFDHRLFGVSAREAALLDPQQRVWLELTWRALEDAGLGDRSDLLTGVFAGSNRSAYLESNIKQDAGLAERLRKVSSSETRQILNGNDKEFLPLRTSYALNLKGPSVNIQTACSTALVAVAMACRTLVNREADVCIAGGVSIIRTSDELIYADLDAIHSVDGRCRPFDASADGTVFGDGGGAVILRRTEDALADGDRIYAVIRGWGVTNDGGVRSSFAAPNAEAQAEAIQRAWDMAGVPASAATYVEAHGTGTKIGDPIEFEGLRRALGAGDKPCGIGSVKPNIGHLDVAAGVAGLIKTCLMLHRKSYLPTVGFDAPNPLLGLERTRFNVETQTRPWRDDSAPLRAGVTALGVGGTNCHLALEQAPLERHGESAKPPSSPQLLVVCAQTPEALERLCDAHAGQLMASNHSPTDYCRAAALGRRHLKFRKTFIGNNAGDLAARLRAPERSIAIATRGARRILFGFSGQLSSYAGMAKDVYQAEPVFRYWLSICGDILAPYLERPLTELLFSDGDDLLFTRNEQPALCAVQIAMAETWKSWGVRPDAVLGYSLGEFAAAYVAGAISLEDVLRLVAKRGQLMEALTRPGFMVSVVGPADGVRAAIGAEYRAEIAGFLDDERCVISGDGSDVDALVRTLTAEGYAYRILTKRYAFHSAWVTPCLTDLEDAASAPDWRAPEVAFISTATGKVERDLIATPNYWVEQARRPVRFSEALASVDAAGCDLCLEVSPGRSLSDIAQSGTSPSLQWLHCLDRDIAEPESIKRCLGQLYEAGVDIDWRSYYAGHPGAWVDLPKYPFKRTSFWIGAMPHAGRQAPAETLNLKATLSTREPALLQDHKLFGQVIVPASWQIAWLLNEIASHWSLDDFVIEDWVFIEPVLIPEHGGVGVEVEIRKTSDAEERQTYAIDAKMHPESGADAITFLTARLIFTNSPDLPNLTPSTQRLDSTYATVRDADYFYSRLWMQRDSTGLLFRRIERIWQGKGEAVARIRSLDSIEEELLSAPVIEAGFQCLHGALTIETEKDLVELQRTWVPYAIERVHYCRPKRAAWGWCRARHDPKIRTSNMVIGAINIFAADGTGVLEVDGFQLRPLPATALKIEARDNDLYRVSLEPAPVETPSLLAPGVSLVVCANGEPAGEIADRLGRRGEECIVLDAASVDFSSKCAAAVTNAGVKAIPLCVLYLDEGAADDVRPNSMATAGCEGLIGLAAILDRSDQSVESFVIATFWNKGQPRLASAATNGVARVLMNEHPDWGVKLVSHDYEIAPESRANDLVMEIGRSDPGEQIVYARDGRHRQTLQSTTLSNDPALLRSDRSYLLIGAANSQTDAVANWLIDRGAGHVVKAIVDATNPAAPANSSITARLLDPKHPQIDDLMQPQQFPKPLAGVFFIPWEMDDGLIQTQTLQRFAAATQSPMDALRRLSKASDAFDLEHFVCFSSSAAVLGTQGQASYAALASVMDALCGARWSDGKPGLSIHWPPWDEMGHWMRTETSRQATLTQGWRPLASENALAVLGRAMASGAPSVSVLPLAWETLSEFNGERGIAVVRRMIAPRTAPRPRSTLRRESAMSILSELIGEDLSNAPDSTLLIEVGLDSLMAIGLRNMLRQTYRTEISLAQLLAHTTLADLRRLDDDQRRSGQAGDEQMAGRPSV